MDYPPAVQPNAGGTPRTSLSPRLRAPSDRLFRSLTLPAAAIKFRPFRHLPFLPRVSPRVIKLTSVYKEYPRSGAALKDVSFHVHKGELVFLTGHSGAGKSTILRLLQMADFAQRRARCASPASRRKTVRRRDIPLLRRKLGVVFQDFRLLRDRTAERERGLRARGHRRQAHRHRPSG